MIYLAGYRKVLCLDALKIYGIREVWVLKIQAELTNWYYIYRENLLGTTSGERGLNFKILFFLS